MRHVNLVIIGKDTDGRWIITRRLLETPDSTTRFCYSASDFEEKKERYLNWVSSEAPDKLEEQRKLIEDFVKENKESYKIDIQMV
jgi:hypothetical protein